MSNTDNQSHDPRVATSNIKLPKALVNPNYTQEDIDQTSQIVSGNIQLNTTYNDQVMETHGIESYVEHANFSTNQPVDLLDEAASQGESYQPSGPVIPKSKASLLLGILGGLAFCTITASIIIIMSDEKGETKPDSVKPDSVLIKPIEMKFDTLNTYQGEFFPFENESIYTTTITDESGISFDITFAAFDSTDTPARFQHVKNGLGIYGGKNARLNAGEEVRFTFSNLKGASSVELVGVKDRFDATMSFTETQIMVSPEKEGQLLGVMTFCVTP